MKDFKKVLKEVNFNLDTLYLFDSIIGSVLVFLAVFLVLSVFNFNSLGALVPSAMYFVIRMYIGFSKDKARIVESRYPELNEKLRTAEDNINLENPIVDELQAEITRDMKHVRLSSFLNTKKVSNKILLSIILCFIIISFSVFGINISLLAPVIENIPNLFGGNRSLGQLSPIGAELNVSDEIYGENSVAKLGNYLIDIKIKPATFEVSVKETGKAERKDFYESFPSEVFVEKTTAYEESVPKEQQELVKNYFKRLSEG